MSRTQKNANVGVGNGDGQLPAQSSSPAAELQDFKSVTNNLLQDALDVWADLWAELEGPAAAGGPARQAPDRFEPSCGWTAFLEKMWVLKHYLDFAKRLSQGGRG